MHFHEVTWMGIQQATSCWQILRDVLGAPWLQNTILALTAVIGIWTLGASSRQERRRATVDVLLETLNDPVLSAARTTVRKLIKAGLDIKFLLSDEGLVNRKLVLSILSRHEFMAAGVREGAFDAELYKRMYFRNTIDDWNDLKAFVIQLRESRNNNTAFQELERLVQDWERHPLKADRLPPTNIPPSPPTPVSTGLGNSSVPAPLGMRPAKKQESEQKTEPPVSDWL
jgi:hypothetical protein